MSLRLANRLDAERLQRLIDEACGTERAAADLLEERLERAEIRDPDEMPDDARDRRGGTGRDQGRPD